MELDWVDCVGLCYADRPEDKRPNALTLPKTRLAAAILLAFASSCFALQVTIPSSSSGWTNQGPQTISWQRVDTDPPNFTILLTNQDRTLFPTDQILVAVVDSTLLSVTVYPPPGGWPSAGAGYRVNLVLSPNDPDTIFAQSDQFTVIQTTASPPAPTATTSSISGTTSSSTSATLTSTSISTSSSSSSSPSLSSSSSLSLPSSSSSSLSLSSSSSPSLSSFSSPLRSSFSASSRSWSSSWSRSRSSSSSWSLSRASSSSLSRSSTSTSSLSRSSSSSSSSSLSRSSPSTSSSSLSRSSSSTSSSSLSRSSSSTSSSSLSRSSSSTSSSSRSSSSSSSRSSSSLSSSSWAPSSTLSPSRSSSWAPSSTLSPSRSSPSSPASSSSANDLAPYNTPSPHHAARLAVAILSSVLAILLFILFWWYSVRRNAKARERERAIRTWTIDDPDLPDGTNPGAALIGTREGGNDPNQRGWYDQYDPNELYDPYLEVNASGPTNNQYTGVPSSTPSLPENVPLVQARPRSSTQAEGQPQAGPSRPIISRKSFTLDGKQYTRSTLGMVVHNGDPEDVGPPSAAITGR